MDNLKESSFLSRKNLKIVSNKNDLSAFNKTFCSRRIKNHSNAYFQIPCGSPEFDDVGF